MGFLDNVISNIERSVVTAITGEPPVPDPEEKVKDSVNLIKKLLGNETVAEEDIKKIKDNWVEASQVKSSNSQGLIDNRADKYTNNRGFWCDALLDKDLTGHFKRGANQPEARNLISNLQKLVLCLKDGKLEQHNRDDLKFDLKKCFGLDGVSIEVADPEGIERHSALTNAFNFVSRFKEYEYQEPRSAQ